MKTELQVLLGPSLEEACAMPNCPICGRPKFVPNKPVCLSCWNGPTNGLNPGGARLDYPGFHDAIRWVDDKATNSQEAWDRWCSMVLAKRN